MSDGVAIKLLHPLDVLESRLRNLDSIPARRNAIGVAQARLAVSVVRAFIEDLMDGGQDPRKMRQAVKRVERIALDTRLTKIALTYDIDVLAAIPVERIAYPRFHELQWPEDPGAVRTEAPEIRDLASATESPDPNPLPASPGEEVGEGDVP